MLHHHNLAILPYQFNAKREKIKLVWEAWVSIFEDRCSFRAYYPKHWFPAAELLRPCPLVVEMANGQLKLHPALFVVDMQNSFVHNDGTFAKLGFHVSNHQDVIPIIKKLIDSFQSKKLPVFFFRLAFNEDYSDAGILVDKVPFVKDMRGAVRGTWDADIVDELNPSSEDLGRNKNWVLMDKKGHSAFFKTGLEERLQEMKIDQVVVTGVSTNICVEATVRDAFSHGFPALIVSDATATWTKEMRDASINNMRSWFGDEITAEQVEQGLEGFTSE